MSTATGLGAVAAGWCATLALETTCSPRASRWSPWRSCCSPTADAGAAGQPAVAD
ncbi:hypothetical protein [Actinophytocola sp.]|uniref:hypothetical protein n=1 Tax=Actinophytocola sp. TaxID=1872138 RepID=UPI003D6ABEF1